MIPIDTLSPGHTDLCMHWGITVKSCAYGRGVFACQTLAAGQVVARCPAIIVPRADLHSQTLATYVFLWPDENGDSYALLGGIGSFLNHCRPANTAFRADVDRGVMVFTTTCLVAAGEELSIDYDYDLQHVQGNPLLAWYH